MRRRLDQLLNETFEYETPKMVLSVQKLDLTAEENETLEGTFRVSHPEGKKIRGFVYSSNARIRTEPGDFYSSDAEIRYQIDLNGLSAGESAEGIITFCTDIGVYQVPCSASVHREDVRSEISPELLTKLAKKDWNKACGVFASEAFAASMPKEDFEDRTLAEALRSGKNPRHALEEYLVGTGRKEPVELSLDSDGCRFEDPDGPMREVLRIRKNTEGYLAFSVSSDTRFLRVESRSASTLDFTGDTWELNYIIDTNFLHAGRNWGRITVRTPYQTLEYVVCVELHGSTELQSRMTRSLMIQRALRLYIDYRLGKIELNYWTERMRAVIGSYRSAGGNDLRAEVMELFVLQAEGKRASAERELHRIGRNVDFSHDWDAEAAWIYLSSYFSRNPEYNNHLRERLRNLYLQHRNSWIVRYIMLFMLADEMGGEEGRLEAIIRQCETGPASPVLLAEGALIALQNPFLLHEWRIGVRDIVHFAVKEGIADERLMLHSAGLIRRSRRYDAVTFRMLAQCYEITRLDDVLHAWCEMAIIGKKTDEKYFDLYRTALMRNLQITDLYEYYLETMGGVRIEAMPDVIRRYFVMDETIDWKKRAKIFRSIAESSSALLHFYLPIKPVIEKFVTEQLQLTRVNEDLAVLYARYLTSSNLTPALAKKLIRVLFTFEIDCRNPSMKRVVVADTRLSRVKKADLTDGKALVRIYSEQSRILLESEDGELYASDTLCQARHLLDDSRLMHLCAKLVPEDPGIELFYVLNPQVGRPITHKTLCYFLSAVSMSALSDSYRMIVRKWLLEYYNSHSDEETMRHFLKHIDAAVYAEIDRSMLIGLFAQEGLYDSAYRVLEQTGTEGIDLQMLVRICAQIVLAKEYEEEEQLTAFCMQCFEDGIVEEHLLSYLMMHYEGPVEQMKALWRVGREYGLDTLQLEKRILSLIVFTHVGTQGAENIYRSYRRALGNRRLCQAYAILCSYEYLVKGLPVSDVIFEDCLNDYRKGGRLPDVCALALLQHLACLQEMTAEQKKAAASILTSYGSRGIRFAFCQRLPQEMKASLGLEDKVFCETVADPASTVRLYFRVKHENGPFTEEVMRNVFEGIRVREFVLFEGEELECYTEEIRPDGTVITSPHRYLKCGAVPKGLEDTRYGRIAEMGRLLKKGRTDDFRHALEQYRELDVLTREIFTWI